MAFDFIQSDLSSSNRSDVVTIDSIRVTQTRACTSARELPILGDDVLTEPLARRINVFTGAGRRRMWSPKAKAQIVAERYALCRADYNAARRLPYARICAAMSREAACEVTMVSKTTRGRHISKWGAVGGEKFLLSSVLDAKDV